MLKTVLFSILLVASTVSTAHAIEFVCVTALDNAKSQPMNRRNLELISYVDQFLYRADFELEVYKTARTVDERNAAVNSRADALNEARQAVAILQNRTPVLAQSLKAACQELQ